MHEVIKLGETRAVNATVRLFASAPPRSQVYCCLALSGRTKVGNFETQSFSNSFKANEEMKGSKFMLEITVFVHICKSGSDVKSTLNVRISLNWIGMDQHASVRISRDM